MWLCVMPNMMILSAQSSNPRSATITSIHHSQQAVAYWFRQFGPDIPLWDWCGATIQRRVKRHKKTPVQWPLAIGGALLILTSQHAAAVAAALFPRGHELTLVVGDGLEALPIHSGPLDKLDIRSLQMPSLQNQKAAIKLIVKKMI